jgi:hypothetical protein
MDMGQLSFANAASTADRDELESAASAIRSALLSAGHNTGVIQ